MSRLSIHGEVPGILTSQVGVPVTVHTVVGSPLDAIQVDASLIESATTPTVVRIGDGTNDHSFTIPAGQKAHSEAVPGVTWPIGAAIQVEVTSAPGDEASSLAVNVLAAETQPVSGATTGLITLDELKSALAITGADTAQDAFLTRQIAVASDLVRRYCRRRFTRTTYRDTWYCPTHVLAVDYPLESIIAATVDTTALDMNTELAFNPTTGEIYRLSGTTRYAWAGVQYLSLDYIAGADPVPASVAECLIVGINQRWKGYDEGDHLNPQMSTVGITFPDAGGIRYASGAPSQNDLVNYLAGFPLSLLDTHREYSRIRPDSSVVL